MLFISVCFDKSLLLPVGGVTDDDGLEAGVDDAGLEAGVDDDFEAGVV
jgi:hypothetical protein